jgi:hypothetical protein
LDTIRVAYQTEFKARLTALREEEKPLAEKVEGKQSRRRAILSARLRNSIILFTAFFLPTLAGIILTAVFGAKIPTTRENTYVLPTIISGAVSFVFFILAVAFANKLMNAIRIYAKNERLSSTEDGNRLEIVRAYASLYEELITNLPTPTQTAQEENEKVEEVQEAQAELPTEEPAPEAPAEENEETSQAE